MFRKRFHVPSRWASIPEIVELAERRYQPIESEMEVGAFIEERLRKHGYSKDAHPCGAFPMWRDYMHFLLIDLVTAEGHPFVTKEDIAEMPALKALFGDTIPDLIIKSNGYNSNRAKPLIIDVVLGESEKESRERAAKYHKFEVVFDFVGLTIGNYRTELYNREVITKRHVDYFHRQNTYFYMEHSYWIDCLEHCNRLDENGVASAEEVSVPPPGFALEVEAFKTNLAKKATTMANTAEL